ncbi:MAG: valine--tRNA ligase [Endomicrobium sp.]|jgi:valyl-tRNA synthetase|nr:valine--tRNA ligase [Endomicrobium sp.]
MKGNLTMDKVYNHVDNDKKWYNYWLNKKIFSTRVNKNKKPFVAILPPPNITGTLHMGHALNAILQDSILRFKKLQGYNTLWVPGLDHGGIATQNVLEKSLKKENKTIYDLGRKNFLIKMKVWENNVKKQILDQLKLLGCCLDWNRTAFTMDKSRSNAVKKAFILLYNKGIIYRGSKIVNWCVKCRTALSDIEVEYETEHSKLWYIKYPICNSSDSIVIATSRPETIFGDTAVAAAPDDNRYVNLFNKTIMVPLINRKINLISDYVVDKLFGTGAVKVTPAHDHIDNEIALRHNLDILNVINTNGKMINVPSRYINLSIEEARDTIVTELKNSGFLVKVDNYSHSVKKCYRCSTKIEPLVSEQWFLDVKNMSKKAIDVVRQTKQIKFYPQSWEKSYVLWLENLRDWCISRQIWWGHRIPVYYCTSKHNSCKPIASFSMPKECPYCKGTGFVQDDDVLDTWFSSALWPLSVFDWGNNEYNEDFKYFYPTSVLVTGHEILYLWVARMIQFSLEFTDKIPYKDVVIHGIIRDSYGKKMSKSLGNTIDPKQIIDKYGADSLRFGLMKVATQGKDIQISNDMFLYSRNFINKIWNASKFVFANIKNANISVYKKEIQLNELVDKWIVIEYKNMAKKVYEAYQCYNIDIVAREIYDFFWHKYCDWYIEFAKIRINKNNTQDKKDTQLVLIILITILNETLRLLYPIVPFVTSELLEFVNKVIYNKHLDIVVDKLESEVISKQMTTVVQDIITKIRVTCNEMHIPLGTNIKALFYNNIDNVNKEIIKKNECYIKELTKIDSIQFIEKINNIKNYIIILAGGYEIYLLINKPIEYKKERIRIEKELSNTKKTIKCLEIKLKNVDFINKAPKSEITKVTVKFNNLMINIKKLQMYLDILKT